MTRTKSERWPPRRVCFVPRLGEYLAHLEQEPLPVLLDRPAALGRALRRASTLLSLEVECLDLPAAWILHSAGWPATVGERAITLASATTDLRGPAEAVSHGPLRALAESLRALRSLATTSAPATLVALPSPATLAKVAGADRAEWSRAVLQALVRSLGELDVLAGIIFDDDDGILSLGRLLDHYQLTPVCIRHPDDTRPAPAGALVALAVPIVGLVAATDLDLGGMHLVTTEGPVEPSAAPEDLLRASRAIGACVQGATSR